MIRKMFAALLISLVPVCSASAQTCGAYPANLTNGTNADASAVMSNFASILTCANNNLAARSGTTFTGATNFTGGNVGVGTASPASKLDVQSPAPAIGAGLGQNMFELIDTSSPAVDTGGSMAFGGKVQTASGPISTITFAAAKGGRENSGNDNYAGYLAFYTTSPGATFQERMRITSSGAVGIGMLPVGYTLQVNGSVAGIGMFTNWSDGRLKKNVASLDHGLDTVMKLRPVGFNWITQDQEWKKQHQIGLIAQEVESLVPEAVTTASDALQTKSIAYGAFVPILIKAVQELKADNDNLRAAHDSEAAQIATLTARLDAMEAARGTRAAVTHAR
jgi:hypothetical protein